MYFTGAIGAIAGAVTGATSTMVGAVTGAVTTKCNSAVRALMIVIPVLTLFTYTQRFACRNNTRNIFKAFVQG